MKISDKSDNDNVEHFSASNSEDQEAFSKEDLRCRFYRNEWPEVDELVVVSTFILCLLNTS